MDHFTPYALVVDDDTLVRMDASFILQDAGFRTFQAGTPEAAMGLLDEHHDAIQLLFTDVNMPPSALTGYDLARYCAGTWPEIGILVASGQQAPQPGDLPESAVFIHKPFSTSVVIAHLKKILPDGKQPKQLRVAAP